MRQSLNRIFVILALVLAGFQASAQSLLGRWSHPNNFLKVLMSLFNLIDNHSHLHLE